jgi:hypothetical protein
MGKYVVPRYISTYVHIWITVPRKNWWVKSIYDIQWAFLPRVWFLPGCKVLWIYTLQCCSHNLPSLTYLSTGVLGTHVPRLYFVSFDAGLKTKEENQPTSWYFYSIVSVSLFRTRHVAVISEQKKLFVLKPPSPGLPDFTRYNTPKREKYSEWP